MRDLYCEVGVGVIGGFFIEYDIISFVENGIGYVCGFGVSGMRVFDYGFEYLSGSNYRFVCGVVFVNYYFLC